MYALLKIGGKKDRIAKKGGSKFTLSEATKTQTEKLNLMNTHFSRAAFQHKS